MILSGDSILELLPQRPPMVMIDGLLSCEGPTVVTTLEIRAENIFVSDGIFRAPGLIENMAQTAAARTGLQMKQKQGAENKKVPVGVIGSVKNFRLHFSPAIGARLVTTLQIEHEVLMATVARATVEANGKLAAEADLQIFLTEEETRTT